MSSPNRSPYDSLEESFFAKPVAALPDDVDEPLTAIDHAFVEARRARFARYVTAATVMAALVCVAAFTLH